MRYRARTARPAVREYLAAERAYYDRWLESVRALRDELAARAIPAEESVSWSRVGHTYFTRTVPGREYEQFCRAVSPGRPAQVLLDENLLLAEDPARGGYLGLGVREISPDGRLLAYSVDFDGDELYQLRIRDLTRGTDLPDRIEGTYYGLAWSADSRSLLYVVTDAQYRPHEVWRHVLGTGPHRDALVFREEDQRFELTVRATRSGAYVLIETASRDSTETLLLPAARTDEPPAAGQVHVVPGRRLDERLGTHRHRRGVVLPIRRQSKRDVRAARLDQAPLSRPTIHDPQLGGGRMPLLHDQIPPEHITGNQAGIR